MARLLGDEADNDDLRQRLKDVMPAIRSASVAETFPAAATFKRIAP
jgi:hypothetical protein